MLPRHNADQSGRKVFSGDVLFGEKGILVKLLQNVSEDGTASTNLMHGNLRDIEKLDKFMHHDIMDGSKTPLYSFPGNVKIVVPFTTDLMGDICKYVHQWSSYYYALPGGSNDNMLAYLYENMLLPRQPRECRVFDDQFDFKSFKNGGSNYRHRVVTDEHDAAARYMEEFYKQDVKYIFFVSRLEHHPYFRSEEAWLKRMFPGLTSIRGFINPILVPDSSHPTLDVASPVRNSVCTPIRPSESSLVFTPKDDSSSDDDFEMDDGVFVLKERSRDTSESETSSKIQQKLYRAESPLESTRTKKRRVVKEGDMVLFADDRGNIDGNNEAYEIAGQNALFPSSTEESHSEQEEEDEDDVRNGGQQAREVAPVSDSASEGDEADNEFEEESE